MGTGIIAKKFDVLPDSLKLKVEGYIDALFNEYGISLSDSVEQKSAVERNEFEIKPGFGGGKGIFGYMADDFDVPLKEFHDYSYSISVDFIEKIEKLSIQSQEKLEPIADEMLSSQ